MSVLQTGREAATNGVTGCADGKICATCCRIARKGALVCVTFLQTASKAGER